MVLWFCLECFCLERNANLKKNILWDLDGTLTDPKKGIINCFQFSLREHDMPVPPENELLWCIGPPLLHSFKQILPNATEELLSSLVTKFRERYAKSGVYENEIYPGIESLLIDLQDRKNFLATAKPHVFALTVIDYFKLGSYFSNLYGSELDGTRAEKDELIAHILKSENFAAENAIMIGDRKYDVIGAKRLGLTSIGVTWGYGGHQELDDAGADYIVNSVDELKNLLRKI